MARVAANEFRIGLLDRWIQYAVLVLWREGIRTYESCQGGKGHAFPEPTIRFEGTTRDARKAVRVAVSHGLPVHYLRRFWRVTDAALESPAWEMTFTPHAVLRTAQRRAERAGLLELDY